MTERHIEDFKDNHAVIIGGTRKGKSKAMQLFFRSTIRRGTEGATPTASVPGIEESGATTAPPERSVTARLREFFKPRRDQFWK